jgi:hypothetical protein
VAAEVLQAYNTSSHVWHGVILLCAYVVRGVPSTLAVCCCRIIFPALNHGTCGASWTELSTRRIRHPCSTNDKARVSWRQSQTKVSIVLWLKPLAAAADCPTKCSWFPAQQTDTTHRTPFLCFSMHALHSLSMIVHSIHLKMHIAVHEPCAP